MLLRLLPLAVWGIACAAAAAAEPAPPPDLPWRVYRVLQQHCSDCHGGHLRQPKGDFGFVLDLERVRQEYVTPGQPARSELYEVLVSPDPTTRMPPPKSAVPPLAPADVELLRQWIQGGAQTGLAAAAAGPVASPAAADAGAVAGSAPRAAATPEAARAPAHRQVVRFGRLHPLVIHFPIALLLTAFLAELFYLFLPNELCLSSMARSLLWLAVCGGLGAVATGWVHASAEGFAPATVQAHRWLGVATGLLSLFALGALELWRCRRRHWQQWLYRVALALAAALAGLTGHSGGMLVYGKDFLA